MYFFIEETEPVKKDLGLRNIKNTLDGYRKLLPVNLLTVDKDDIIISSFFSEDIKKTININDIKELLDYNVYIGCYVFEELSLRDFIESIDIYYEKDGYMYRKDGTVFEIGEFSALLMFEKYTSEVTKVLLNSKAIAVKTVDDGEFNLVQNENIDTFEDMILDVFDFNDTVHNRDFIYVKDNIQIKIKDIYKDIFKQDDFIISSNFKIKDTINIDKNGYISITLHKINHIYNIIKI